MTGHTALHSELARNKEAVLNDFRSMAFSVGQGDIWIEKLKIKTSTPRTLSEGEGANPLTGMLEWLDELSYEELLQEIRVEFQSLHNALPMDLKRGEEQVIPDSEDVLKEKLQSIKDVIKDGLLQERGQKA